MEKGYEPQGVETRLYEQWETAGYFHAEPTPGKPKYSITIPPPNVTGSLHMGHALNHSIQDTLGRWHRMRGFTTLILPGTDHAGIATQSVVEREIAKEGLTRYDLGRDAFVERVWAWREQYGQRIITQLKRLGCSYDWQRLRFTLDAGYAEAVLEAFVRFFDAGLIYRGKRLVNWCCFHRTVISDVEVEEEEQAGHLWHIRYPYADGSGYVTVATTRPETMLGDSAVAVNPTDERYEGKVGKMIALPLSDRQIPLIADDYAQAEFGTGAVKVTPAHDPNDYEAGLRHDLPQFTVIGFDGSMTPEAGDRYSGLDRYEARNLVVADLEELGLLEKVEDHPHRVPTCERCHTTIEPLLSDQWFMKMAGTAIVDKAIEVAEDGTVNFVPDRYKRTYLNWMSGIRDWALSRQLWWGHRIPIYYRPDGTYVAAKTWDEAVAKAGTDQLIQDEDVLDTWFSSALWPFATMGWPEKTPDLEYFYPTDMLTTAGEILRLWVARMIMTGEEFMGAEPFHDVYIHATVLDKKGRRMQKSVGNGIDPVEMIDKYGADALRFSLLRLASKGQDIKFDESRIPDARNFANKLWNAARFVLMNLGDDGGPHPAFGTPPPSERERGQPQEAVSTPPNAYSMMSGSHWPLSTSSGGGVADEAGVGASPSLPERWIVSRLQRTIERVNSSLGTYDFDEACGALYEFVWNEFCDWFVELSKPALQGDDLAAKQHIRGTLYSVLETTLRLLHPIMPFVTEEIWQALPHEGDSLCIAPYPLGNASLIDAEAETAMGLVIDSISALRSLRADFTPGGPENEAARATILTRRFTVTVVPETLQARTAIQEQLSALTALARLGQVQIADAAPTDQRHVPTGVTGATFYIPASELLEGIDPARESARLALDMGKIDKELVAIQGRLGNANFLERAAPEAVEKARQDAADLAERRAKLDARRALLKE
jgi:valyl-tRNA synthetase